MYVFACTCMSTCVHRSREVGFWPVVEQILKTELACSEKGCLGAHGKGGFLREGMVSFPLGLW